LHELTLSDMQSVNDEIDEGVYSVLSVENSVASRMSYGGTAPEQVRFQIKRWKEILEQ
ncbi:MAG: argininosuccinate lyase, partial [Paracoccaceae bacterium]